MNETIVNGFLDELRKLAGFMGAPKAGFLRRLAASPRAVARTGGGRLSQAFHAVSSRAVPYLTTYRSPSSRIGQALVQGVGGVAGVAAANKAMDLLQPQQQEQQY